ncbi:MAG: class I SAM-dependent methyltransferase [Rhizobiaceae bacterium]
MSVQRYHEAMFGGEQINEQWIDDCSRYLREVFGDAVSGKTVVDYGFGRGNWSLAFQRLGAKKVIAVDASQSGVNRFSTYVKANDIPNITVLAGNTDDAPLNLSCDIVFLYGILHHVKDPKELLNQAASWLCGKDGTLLIYAYDRGSLREIIVSKCRAMTKGGLNELPGWQNTLHPLARHRATDDLVAPVVTFWSPERLESLLAELGLKCIAQFGDFSAFQGKSLKPEFDPYVLLVAPAGHHEKQINIEPNKHAIATEYRAIECALDVIVDADGQLNKTAIALGIFNTAFARNPKESFEDRVFYLWCHLTHLFSSHAEKLSNEGLDEVTRDLMQITVRKIPAKVVESKMRHVLDAYPTLTNKACNTSYRI